MRISDWMSDVCSSDLWSRIGADVAREPDDDRRQDRGDGVVAEQLREQERDAVDEEYEQPGRRLFEHRRHPVEDQGDAPRLFEPEADGEHGEDEDQDVAVDRAPGFQRIDAAEQENGADRDDRGDGDGRDVEGGDDDHRRQRRYRDWSEVGPERAGL